jgi:hypothetical protein
MKQGHPSLDFAQPYTDCVALLSTEKTMPKKAISEKALSILSIRINMWALLIT